MIRGPQCEHGGEVLDGAIRASQVGLVDHQDVSDFEYAGFDRLDVVSHARCTQDNPGVSDISDLGLRLPGADGF